MKRYDKIKKVHDLKKEGYTHSQVAEMMGVSVRTINRMLKTNPECLCTDGTQTREVNKLLDPYREQIQKFIELGFKNAQIRLKLQSLFPDVSFKRSTLGDYCANVRSELYECTEILKIETRLLASDSIVAPYAEKISAMRSENKTLKEILSVIKAEGYRGSYSLLQQYCFSLRPILCKKKKAYHKIKRKNLTSFIWSGNTDLSKQDIEYVYETTPILREIKNMVTEFRTAYTNKDIESVKVWCAQYAECVFPKICSFINGLNADADAFYNSMKYEYSNGLLEGCVNKLKAVKRSMYGRASYELLRAKLLLDSMV